MKINLEIEVSYSVFMKLMRNIEGENEIPGSAICNIIKPRTGRVTEANFAHKSLGFSGHTGSISVPDPDKSKLTIII